MKSRFPTYPPRGSIVVSVTRRLFGGHTKPTHHRPTHYTVMLPGIFETTGDAVRFIAKLQGGGEYTIECAA